MIQKKILAAISILLLAGFMGTNLVSFAVSRYSLVNLIEMNSLPLTSDNIYSEIQRDLLRPILISSVMANDTFLRDWVLSGENDRDRIRNYLNEIRVKYGTFTSFFVSDRTGIYYHSGGVLKKVRSGEERDRWYYRVKNMKEDFEINVDPDMANRDTMTIFINYKVFDYGGRFIGATGVGLNASAVKKLINQYQDRYRCNIYFVSPSGDLVLYSAARYGKIRNIAQIDGLDEIAGDLFKSGTKTFRYRGGGRIVHLNVRYIPEFKWYLFVEQSENSVTRGIIYTLGINLVICLVLAAVILFITYVTLRRYQGRLETMAITDKLTGVFNRQMLDHHLELAIMDAERHGNVFSMVIVDIDRFKEVNDGYGHLAGDAVLCDLVLIIKTVVRNADIVSRWGGDEFIMILDRCGTENALIVAEKILSCIRLSTVEYEGKPVPYTASIGVTQYRPDDTPTSIVARADYCLYVAKDRGRDRIETD